MTTTLFEHQDREPLLGQPEGADRATEPAADHDHVGGVRVPLWASIHGAECRTGVQDPGPIGGDRAGTGGSIRDFPGNTGRASKFGIRWSHLQFGLAESIPR
ncbi:hypothetical protein GCM10009570_11020 [Dietzia natronolimnaea]